MNELFSVGDDNQILKWDINGDHVSFFLTILLLKNIQISYVRDVIGVKSYGD